MKNKEQLKREAIKIAKKGFFVKAIDHIFIQEPELTKDLETVKKLNKARYAGCFEKFLNYIKLW